jgi:hypothetical protein
MRGSKNCMVDAVTEQTKLTCLAFDRGRRLRRRRSVGGAAGQRRRGIKVEGFWLDARPATRPIKKGPNVPF